ncbi:ATP-binding cassette domain-containing protein [Nakamurella deserti]|uniref:ATP-binding cassette domain-containing protein n=1 Tax=Nakamurella deserti TaxID=2164074 RepID=UPI000DBE8668|nr:ATP-binding cassette domain-containing protein [Nakamurella deserti]
MSPSAAEFPTAAAATTVGQPILTGRGLSKSFGGVHALSGVDLDLHPGRVTALVGDNGAGKSTLTKMLSGIYSVDEGTITIRGQQRRLLGPDDASSAGIQTVYQDLALCDNLNTVQNLFLGREVVGSRITGRRLQWSEMEHRATQVLGELGVKIRSLVTPVGQLSGGQRQGIAICRSVLTDPAVVLLDEPTAALGVAQKEQVLHLLARLRDQGRAVMVISHDLHDVQQIADTVVVLRLGRKVAELRRGEFDSSDIVDAITGASTPRTGAST